MGTVDKVAQVVEFPYGVTRKVVDAGVSLGKSEFGGDPDAPTLPPVPPPAPDLASDAVQRAAQAKRLRLLMGGLNGPLDLTSAAGKPPGLTGA
jgi:hypothetical protein